MPNPYLGEIRVFAFGAIPTGWMACDGQILKVQEHQALFSLLKERNGGDGHKTFALPDLRGRTPIGMGRFDAEDQPRVTYPIGKSGGAEAVNLPADQAPFHTHPVAAQSGAADIGTPNGSFFADAKEAAGAASLPTYALPGAMVAFDKSSVTTAGAGEPLSVRQPFQVLTFCIAIKGDYPPRAD